MYLYCAVPQNIDAVLLKTVHPSVFCFCQDRQFPRHARPVRASPITRKTFANTICHRSASRLYLSCKCGLFGCTCNIPRPLKPMQIISEFQVIFYLMPSSGRRRNKAPPPARRSWTRAGCGARSTFRPSVPDSKCNYTPCICNVKL